MKITSLKLIAYKKRFITINIVHLADGAKYEDDSNKQT